MKVKLVCKDEARHRKRTRISDSKWVKPIFSKFRITGDSQVRWSSVPANMTKAPIILILTNHRLD